jgi:hypothetical protein
MKELQPWMTTSEVGQVESLKRHIAKLEAKQLELERQIHVIEQDAARRKANGVPANFDRNPRTPSWLEQMNGEPLKG